MLKNTSKGKASSLEHRVLSDSDFAYLVSVAPLVSIDLVIRDHEQNVLLGLRANEPAKGYYFVPGGVIRKDEPIGMAFSRILKAEIGQHGLLKEAKFIGPYEHFYAENRYGDPTYGTHYVVLAYELGFEHCPQIALDSQHTQIRWMNESDLLAAADVHANTKAYFHRS